MRFLVIAVASLLPAAGAQGEPPLFPALSAQETPRARLIAELDRRAFGPLEERARQVAAIETRAELEARRDKLRARILDLIGALPVTHGPPHAKALGQLAGDGFVVEKLTYESLPGFVVTASLYHPPGRGPFPGVLASVGHGDFGKAGERTGPDLARRGFAVLVIDPIGQGERQQHFDVQLGASRAAGPVEEHGQAAARAEIVGDSFARALIWDAMRGLDYLASRPDVDRDRLGATGCSGGGTVTTYLAALDERVKVAGIACYLTTWRALLTGPGPQEAEQSIHGFLSSGLDMGDYLALIAPRPLQIVSTEQDFFPLAGAKAEVDEARRYYRLLGAEDHLAFTVGPGGHGNPREGREAIAGFFLRWLAEAPGPAAELPDARLDPEELDCTPTGQLGSASKSFADLVAARAAELAPSHPFPSDVVDRAEQAERTAAAARRLAGIAVVPGGPPPVAKIWRTVARPGYRLDVVTLTPAGGIPFWGLLATPGGAPRRPATLIVEPALRTRGATVGGELDQRASAGDVVLAIEPRGTPLEGEPSKPSLLGASAALYRRASVVGTTLVGLRAEDIIHAVDWLAARPDVDGSRIAGYAAGGSAVALLHAAVLDLRLARVALEEMLPSYRIVLEHPLHRDLPESLVPGALPAYDLPDLLFTLAPRKVALIDPVGATGVRLRKAELVHWLTPLQDGERQAGHGSRIQVLHRNRHDPLRWE